MERRWREYTGASMGSPGTTTVQAPGAHSRVGEVQPVAGLVVIFANRRPRFRVFRWEGAPLTLGRVELAEDDTQDPLISRQHLRLRFDGSNWLARDLGSRNGTFLGGAAFEGEVSVAPGSLLRVGGALLIPALDILGFQRYGLGLREGIVGGPALRKALETVALSRRADMLPSLLISGESGTGKEIAAQVFHDSGPKPGAPFVAVNCATIPKEIAERLLFGSRRGAFSGATDAPGHVQTAHGGTLFLDEIAELDADVQTKLLRMLETRQVLRLGATNDEPVDVRVCAATWRDLRQEVAAGRFREDLYFRIGQPEIRLPALRERIEEMPWHIQQLLDACRAPLGVSATFVEACAARTWPGNVRELRAEVRRAAALRVQDGEALTAEDLAPQAGQPIGGGTLAAAATFPADEIAAALTAEDGNVLGAARRLGIHRNKIRRWLERFGLEASRFKTERR